MSGKKELQIFELIYHTVPECCYVSVYTKASLQSALIGDLLIRKHQLLQSHAPTKVSTWKYMQSHLKKKMK